MTLGFRNNALDAPQRVLAGPGRGADAALRLVDDGPIVKGRTGFSLNVRSNNENDVQTIVATTPEGSTTAS